MPSDETSELLRRAEQLVRSVQPDEEARRRSEEALNRLDELAGRRPRRRPALESDVEHLLTEVNGSLVVAREPKTNGAGYVPDFLVTAGNDRYLVEVRPSAAEGRRAADALVGVLDAYEATEAFVVVPEGEQAAGDLGDDRIQMLTPSGLRGRLAGD
jgi:hypothetical protein